MFTSPTPRAVPAAVDSAVSMSAPLTWSGVQLGYLARSCEAAPATIGEANEVPDIHMKPEVVTRSGCSSAIVEDDGTGPVRYRPGAPMSGFAKPSRV
jgi:hypothetical protein